jgi:small subunit ribosomal protein S3
MGTRVALHVTRPGIVIGRKGTGIRALTEKLATDFELKNPQISVIEIEKPELVPAVMCNRMASHLERGTAFRRATMWTLKQIMEGGAMGVQITISGKLRGDRSAFEKHTQGILPRAGHHAEIIVDEDIAHVKTAMGLIGIRIRIAKKEKLVPEFEMRVDTTKKVKPAKVEKTDNSAKVEKTDNSTKIKVEEIEVDGAKVEVVKVEGKEDTAKSESEKIASESKKMEGLETLEEEEAKLK